MKKISRSFEAVRSATTLLKRHGRSLPVLKCILVSLVFVSLVLIPASRSPLADITFNQALDTQLDGITLLFPAGAYEPCVRLVGGDRNQATGKPIGFGPELTAICDRIPPGGTGSGGVSAIAGSGGGE